MNREFMKSDFYNPHNNKPIEFEIKDYDEALKLKRPSDIPTAIRSPVTEPEIKQEPIDDNTPKITEIPAENPAPAPATKPSSGSRMLKNLDSSGLDGKAWACNDTHGRRLRVQTSKINTEEEYSEHWDNTTSIDDKEIEEKTLPSPI